MSKIQITEELLLQGESWNGSYSVAQLRALGDDMVKGWRFRLLGKWIEEEQAQKFLALKNKHLKNKKKFRHLKLQTGNLF